MSNINWMNRINTFYKSTLQKTFGDTVSELIEELRNNPYEAIPSVLRLLSNKENELMEEQKKIKPNSLDLRGFDFKKCIQNRRLVNEIKKLHYGKKDYSESDIPCGQPMTLEYKSILNPFLLENVNDLLLHHIESGINTERKQKIKQLLRQSVMDLFGCERQSMSDDGETDFNALIIDVNSFENDASSDEKCSVMMWNRNWYLFFRLHNLLYERLYKAFEESEKRIFESENKKQNSESVDDMDERESGGIVWKIRRKCK